MNKNSQKSVCVLTGLVASLLMISFLFKYSNTEKLTVETLKGDKSEFDGANLIYSNNIDYLQDLKTFQPTLNKNLNMNKAILLLTKNNSHLKYVFTEGNNKILFSNKEKGMYNLNCYRLSESSYNENDYIIYNNTKLGEADKFLIKNNGLLRIYKDYYYQDYSLIKYKGDKYIIASFIDEDPVRKPSKILSLNMIALKLNKFGNSYSEVGNKTFLINNYIKKENSTGKYLKSFQFDGKDFLTLKIKDTIHIFTYNPDKNEFMKVNDIDSELLPSLEYDDSLFVNYKNKLYYIYLKGSFQYVEELGFKNNTLVSISKSKTNFVRNTGKTDFSEVKFDKDRKITSKNYEYELWIQSPASKYFVKDNRIIFITENIVGVSAEKSRYNMNSVYKISILNLDTKKETYSGIVRSNFRSNLNDFFISDKINE